MAVEVILPKVDMDMASAKILKWFVAEGEPVKKGAALFEIETDKAAMEIESPADGLLQQLVKEGEVAEIGAAVGFIMNAGEAPAQAPVKAQAKAAEAPPPVAAPQPITPAQVSNGLRATPLARRLARETGLDIKLLNGTGPHGRIVADDVRTAAETKPAPASAAGMQQYHLTIRCNAASLLALQQRLAAHGRDFSIADFVSKAFTAAALRTDAAIQDRHSIVDLGAFGIEEGTAIVAPPNAATLVIGAAVDGHIRMTLCATSEIEHAKAADLLKHLRSFVEDPLLMLA
jgi:pyruvate/2-oxoglutarate dehydrogenase complex dihydrolipoamide acyltransferase (E2) component